MFNNYHQQLQAKSVAYQVQQADAPVPKEAQMPEPLHASEAKGSVVPSNRGFQAAFSMVESAGQDSEMDESSPNVAPPRSLNPTQNNRYRKPLVSRPRIKQELYRCTPLGGDNVAPTQLKRGKTNARRTGGNKTGRAPVFNKFSRQGRLGGINSPAPLINSEMQEDHEEDNLAQVQTQLMSLPGTPTTNLANTIQKLRIDSGTLCFEGSGKCYWRQATGDKMEHYDTQKALLKLAEYCRVYPALPLEPRSGQFVLNVLVKNIARCVSKWQTNWIIERMELCFATGLGVYVKDRQTGTTCGFLPITHEPVLREALSNPGQYA